MAALALVFGGKWGAHLARGLGVAQLVWIVAMLSGLLTPPTATRWFFGGVAQNGGLGGMGGGAAWDGWAWSWTLPGALLAGLAALPGIRRPAVDDLAVAHARVWAWLGLTVVAMAETAFGVLAGMSVFALGETIAAGTRSRRAATAAATGLGLATLGFAAAAMVWTVALYDASRGQWSSSVHEIAQVVLNVDHQQLAPVAVVGLGALLGTLPFALWLPIRTRERAPAAADEARAALGLLLVQVWFVPLAPRAMAEWAEPMAWLATGGGLLAGIAATGTRRSSGWIESGAGAVPLVGALSQTGAGMAGAWAWVLGRALARRLIEPAWDGSMEGAASRWHRWGRAGLAGAPGTVSFAGLVAVVVGVMDSIEVFEHPGLVAGALLAVVALLGAAGARDRGAAPPTISASRGAQLAASAMAGLILAGGLFPTRVLAPVIDDSMIRGEELQLRRCADVELRRIPRSRLRSEMRIDCGDPAGVLHRVYGGGR
jgi:hypothetical protein